MKIKELIKILEQAPDKEQNVYIPHIMIMPKSKTVRQVATTSIGSNFDDDCNFEMYVISSDDR